MLNGTPFLAIDRAIIPASTQATVTTPERLALMSEAMKSRKILLSFFIHEVCNCEGPQPVNELLGHCARAGRLDSIIAIFRRMHLDFRFVLTRKHIDSYFGCHGKFKSPRIINKETSLVLKYL
jgi:hypothetical protein